MSAVTRFVLLAAAVHSGPALAADAPGKIQFNRDIRPIFSETCFHCHGFDAKQRKADLRLDVAAEAYKTRKDLTAIVPRDLAKSEAWQRIVSTDPDEQMPPPKSHLKLTDAEKATIKRWIEEGAEYQIHWSFIPPRKAELPKIQNTKHKIQDEIDRFIFAKLAEEGLEPSPEADRYTLIRRVSLDLTGLPPSAAEVAAFLNDRDPKAYEKLVDRLLASPHFGERLALDWMDASRYADTNGFSIDGGRHVWLWRDWVINAFNTNKPYDRFLIEQLAGDLLPGAQPEQVVATGWCRNHMITHEGGTIPEENLTNYCVDRVKTFGESMLGLTMGCGQCHDHKYDPISQRDYYRMFAYFNMVDDAGLDGNGGVNARPSMMARTVLRNEAEAAQVAAQLQSWRDELAKPHPVEMARWEQETIAELRRRGAGFKLHPLEILKVTTPNKGSGFDVEEKRLVRISEPAGLAAYDCACRLPPLEEPVRGIRMVFHADDSAPGGGRGHGMIPGEGVPAEIKPARPGKAVVPFKGKGTFVVTGITASAGVVGADQVDLFHILRPLTATASSAHPKFPATNALDGRNEFGWSPQPDADGPQHLTVTFAEPVDTEETPFGTVQVNFGHGDNLIGARFQIFAFTGVDDGTNVPVDVQRILTADAARRSVEQQRRVHDYFVSTAPEFREARHAVANLQERLEVLTREFPTMVMNVAAQPRATHILSRGDYAQPGEAVTAGTPVVLPPAPAGAPENRLGLAQWLTMRDHPLTARVTVNRFWQLFFGSGIVATAADFGSQGEWPSHPELLDWLAVDFAGNGWNVKALVKKMVMSATYRQSSDTGARMMEADPKNLLLARGPRFRLPAELIRDAALKTSGLLVPRIGGPGVNPYQPGDLWREISHYGSTPATAQTFVQDHGEKLYRRSLYTFWKRTVPPPNMAAFDAPNREICTVTRAATNTPLQALVLLNDTQYVEASRAFAEKILRHAAEDEARVRFMFLESISRPPSEGELALMLQALARERDRYRRDRSGAEKYLGVGEAPRDGRLDAAEHAAWTALSSVVLNLSEMVTRS